MSQIAKIETFRVPPRWLFVRVETHEGAVGWVRAAWKGMPRRWIAHLGFYRGGPVLMSALSGLDQALWDLKGKTLGVPVWQLLGGRAAWP